MTQINMIEQLLETTLTAQEYKNLAESLGISKARLTRMLCNPPIATLSEVLGLAGKLKMLPCELVMRYRLGFDTLTLADAEQLGKLDIEPTDTSHTVVLIAQLQDFFAEREIYVRVFRAGTGYTITNPSRIAIGWIAADGEIMQNIAEPFAAEIKEFLN